MAVGAVAPTVALALGICVVALLLAAPADAQPGDSPCAVVVSVFCRFIPSAPELDHDLDLTTGQPPIDPSAPLPETRPPAPLCDFGCV
ncbi:fibronectin-binding protein [Mycolicibacterium fortuitum]|nr:fibronectin-binding protein [Mycolicibacterium fortuitum]